MQDALLQAVRRNQQCIIELCRELCRISTVNPYSGDHKPAGELKGQEFLAGRLRELGARVTTVNCPADIYERMGVLGPQGRDFGARPNVVAEWDFGRPGPRIVINGHMDTVGVDGMAIDPFAAEVRDGRIWSRGASDCKGGLTVALSALEAVLHSGSTLGGSVVLESVVDEECNGSGAGTLACLDAGYSGDIAIFVDGKRDAIVLGCSGCLTADVHVEGKEGHAAYGTGVSAVEKALIVKRAIDEFKHDREAARPNARVNLGIFRAGVHPALVPGSAYLSLNTVYEVDEAAAARESRGVWGAEPLREDFERRIRETESGDLWLTEHPSRIEWVKDLIPFAMPEDLPLAARLAQAHKIATGKSAAYEHMVGWTDACYYAALANVPTVLYGPAQHGAAHTADESVEIDALIEASAGLAVFLMNELAV